ncbi:hypothetical protein A0J61_03895 [Choanephora cucurbitarum]|uniref:Integrase zinc-binding domain-containing protein n=1 Tax=Choanephora cucurbitarum TaxID=101091 RepID=A0A1C7NL78_9FUNG|nr:hypothetical protein A0J61_03895 [Choanephora cucurbitarum]
MDESYIISNEGDRKDILKNAHAFEHFGADPMAQRTRKEEGMNWPRILQDTLEITVQCITCQKFVIAKRGYNPLCPLIVTHPYGIIRWIYVVYRMQLIQ